MYSNESRHYRWHDHLLIGLLNCLRFPLLKNNMQTNVPSPDINMPIDHLTATQKRTSGALMRINHSGEVCAQALYLGQSLIARQVQIREAFQLAAQEESLHLQWCEKRINELGTHSSYLNPLWFSGALLIGSFAGILGDKWSLGFLAETENQVYEHLGEHLQQLPIEDLKSRAIVMQMQQDEAKHASTANALGAATLPLPIKIIMRGMANIMKGITYYV